ELIDVDPNSAQVIRPWLRGRDVKRWKAEWARLYILAIPSSSDVDSNNEWKHARSEEEARRIFRETYPAIHDHLSRWEEYPNPRRPGQTLGLRPRADQGRWWWELRSCTYYSEFERPKILWPEFARRIRFCRSEPGVMANNKCYLWPE